MTSGQKKATALLTTNAQRFIAIERWLRSGGGDFESLVGALGHLGASRATVKRDLKAMREELGAVIVFDHLAGSYSLRDGWKGVQACLLEHFAPPAFTITLKNPTEKPVTVKVERMEF